MSHYSVGVMLPNVKSLKDSDLIEKYVDLALAPFNENLEVLPYVSFTKEELLKYAKNNIQKYKEMYYDKFLEDPERYKEKCINPEHIEYLEKEFPKRLVWTDEQILEYEYSKYNEEEIGFDGEIYSTYNPNSKWDWYTIGGRWSGHITTKQGKQVDYCYVKDIDLTPNKEIYQTAKRYWELIVEGQPLKENEIKPFSFYSKEYYLDLYETKENYATLQSCFSTYALLVDGEWIEPGKMGWFAMSSETAESKKEYTNRFNEILNDPKYQNYVFVVVDCHI
jgi:hypothetical protein